MDEAKACWILEFVLRQPIDDCVANAIFHALPLAALATSSNTRLKKTILLRRIASHLSSRSISDSTLDSLDLIHELDRCMGKVPSPSFKSAYCAVAAECTIKHLRGTPDDSDGDFLDAVNRIWNCRVVDLETSETAAGVVSEQLRKWRKEIEAAAMGDLDARGRLTGSDTEKKALESLGNCWKEALEGMGPAFLEAMAEKVLNGELKGLAFAESGLVAGDDAGPLEFDDPSLELDKRRTPHVEEPGSVETRKGLLYASGYMAEQCAPIGKEVKEKKRTAWKLMAGDEETRDKRPAIRVRQPNKEHYCLSTPEVDKVKEALKSSCQNLQIAVEDPLPAAVSMAAEVLATMADKLQNTKESDHNPNHSGLNDPGPSKKRKEVDFYPSNKGKEVDHGPSTKGTDSPGPSNKRMDVDRGPSDKGTEVTHPEKTIAGNQCHANHEARARPSLTDRNPTAHTYEWGDDSIESPSEGSPSASREIRLPSPKRRRVALLDIPKATKFSRRRKTMRWSVLEEDTLREGVKRYGKGNWKFILSCYASVFDGRTEVDLKDKWRNMTRQM